MGKTKTDRKVNKKIKAFNRSLRQDVFKDRFWVRQYQKTVVNGSSYYLYELMDREEPDRNRIIYQWIRGESPFFMSEIWEEMNDFIIWSNFWDKYWEGKEKNGV